MDAASCSASRLSNLSRQQTINDTVIGHEQSPCILPACNDVTFALQYGAFEDHNSIVLVEEYASMVSQDTASSLCIVARSVCAPPMV